MGSGHTGQQTSQHTHQEHPINIVVRTLKCSTKDSSVLIICKLVISIDIDIDL